MYHGMGICLMKRIGKATNGNYIIEMSRQEWVAGAFDVGVENIGAAMKSHRVKCGKTQAQMAVSMGCSRTYYSMLERGKAENYSWRIRLAIVSELRK